MGKTLLIEQAVERAVGMLVVRAKGVELEAALAFGGLTEVSRPLLGKLDELPDRQAAALRIALTLERGSPPDRLTVGAAMLSLFAAAAEDTPLIVAVDDAHWLDTESAAALVFAARRLQAERVAVLLAARDGEGRELTASGLDVVTLSGLSLEAARRTPVEERARRRRFRRPQAAHAHRRQPARAARAVPGCLHRR